MAMKPISEQTEEELRAAVSNRGIGFNRGAKSRAALREAMKSELRKRGDKRIK